MSLRRRTGYARAKTPGNSPFVLQQRNIGRFPVPFRHHDRTA